MKGSSFFHPFLAHEGIISFFHPFLSHEGIYLHHLLMSFHRQKTSQANIISNLLAQGKEAGKKAKSKKVQEVIEEDMDAEAFKEKLESMLSEGKPANKGEWAKKR